MKTIKKETEIEKKTLSLYHPNDFIHGVLAAHCGSETGIIAGKSEVQKGVNVSFKPEGSLYESFKRQRGTDLNEYTKGWKALEVIDDEQTGYLGIIYINEESKQLVLGHRSTNFALSLTTKNMFKGSGFQQDMEGILLGKILMHQAYGYLATAKAVDYVKSSHKDYALSFTGHSLGSWLAQLSTFYCHADLEYVNVKSVTFDGPGAYEMMKQMTGSSIKGSGKLKLKELDITSYFSAPNIVNSVNKHIGVVYRLFPDIEEKGPDFLRKIIGDGKQDAIISTYGHHLSHILPHFDPESGKPREKYEQVAKWPSITHENYAKRSGHDFSTMAGKTVDAALKAFGGDLTGPMKTLISLSAKLGFKGLDTLLSKITGQEVTTLGGMVYLFADLVNGKVSQEQYWTLHKYLDREANFDLKVLEPISHFSVLYKGNYQTKDVAYNLRKVTDKIDKYLKKLSGVKEEAISKYDNHLLNVKLLNLREKYKYNKLMKSIEVLKPETGVTIDDIRDSIRGMINRDELEDYLSKIINYNDEINTTTNRDNIASHLPSERMSDFVGREEVFKAIDNAFINEQIVALHAFSGAGKSSVALEYGYMQLINSPKVIRWINADTKEKIEAGYRNIATDLDLDTANKTGKEVISMVNNELAKRPALALFFILDNVESYEEIKDYVINLPKKVKVLITTKNSALSNNIKDIQLEPFSKQEAVSYLEKNKFNENEAELLIGKVGLRPFKLSKAVAFLKEKDFITVKEYLSNYSDNTEDNLISNLIKSSPEGWKILQYAAYLDPDFISADIIKGLLQITSEQLSAPAEALKSLSLMERVKTSNDQIGLKIHRLVQEEVSSYISKHPQEALPKEKLILDLVKIINSLLPEVTSLPGEDWKTAQLIQPHAAMIINNNSLIGDELSSEQKEIIADIYYKLAKYQSTVFCNHVKAVEYANKAINIKLEVHPDIGHDNHDNIANSYSNTGKFYLSADNSKKALEYHNKALEVRKKFSPDNKSALAECFNSIGLTYQHLGNCKEALNFFNQALLLRKELYVDSNHEDVYVSLHNVGWGNLILGKPEIALKYYEEALGIAQTVHNYGNHPNIAQILNNLGETYQALKSPEKGLDLHIKAYEMREKLYQGGDHPYVSESLNAIGWAYFDLKKYEEALYPFKLALKMREKLYLGNHTDIAMSLNNIGETYHALEKPQKALKFLEKALKMRQEMNLSYHPDFVMFLNSTGKVYASLGDKAKAIEFYKQAYVISIKTLGEKHITTQNLEKDLSKEAPKFVELYKTREFITQRGDFDNITLEIKQKIQVEVLDKIQGLAAKGKWSKGLISEKPLFPFHGKDWGVKGFVEENYLMEKLGKDLGVPQNVEIAKMLCFEAICFGFMSENSNQNLICVQEFAKNIQS